MPTEKQKLVAQKTLENLGNVSKSMRQSGYSKSYSKNPQMLVSTKGYREAIEELVPHKKSSKIHNNLLHAKVLRSFNFEYKVGDDIIRKIIRSTGGKISAIIISEPNKGKGKNKFAGSKLVYYSMPDQRTVDSALDKLLKTQGVYTTNLNVNDRDWKDDLTDDQLRRLAHGESPESVLGK